jgi:hypothetical protein
MKTLNPLLGLRIGAHYELKGRIQLSFIIVNLSRLSDMDRNDISVNVCLLQQGQEPLRSAV